MDDGGFGHSSSGNAKGKRKRSNADFSFGPTSLLTKDDSAAIRMCRARIFQKSLMTSAAGKVIVGNFWGKSGPVDGIAADPQYLDIYVPAGVKKTFKVDTIARRSPMSSKVQAPLRMQAQEGVLLEKEVMGEEVNIRDMSGNRTLIKFGTGEEVTVQAGEKAFVSYDFGCPYSGTRMAWSIVMNTRKLMQAFAELRNGTFIKPAH